MTQQGLSITGHTLASVHYGSDKLPHCSTNDIYRTLLQPTGQRRSNVDTAPLRSPIFLQKTISGQLCADALISMMVTIQSNLFISIPLS